MKPIFLALIMSILVLSCSEQKQQIESGVYTWQEQEASQAGEVANRTFVSGESSHFSDFEIKQLTFYTDSTPQTFLDDYENLLIVKQGQLYIEIGDDSAVIGSSSVVHIMPGRQYRIFSNEPVSYYLLRYTAREGADLQRAADAGGSVIYDRDSLVFKPSEKGGGTKYFDRPTAMCERYEMHTTMLKRKGPSHKGHTHDETEIILVISGEVSMIIGEKEHFAQPGDFFLAQSGVYHEVHNASEEPCEYFAFKWR